METLDWILLPLVVDESRNVQAPVRLTPSHI